MRRLEEGKAALLRHRFDDIEQLRRHLHMVDSSTLLFYRDPTLTLQTGSPVLVEITFQSSEQTRVLRASVLARAEGQGLWLEIPNTRFARDVHDHGILPRRGRRLGTDELVRMKRSTGSEYTVRLLDLSIGGARIGGGLPPTLGKGQTVGISIAAPEAGRAPEITRGRVVMWSRLASRKSRMSSPGRVRSKMLCGSIRISPTRFSGSSSEHVGPAGTEVGGSPAASLPAAEKTRARRYARAADDRLGERVTGVRSPGVRGRAILPEYGLRA